EDLAVVRDPDLDAREGLADRAEPEVLATVDRRRGRRLRHAPAFEHPYTACVEELEDLLGDRRGSGDGLLDLTAEERSHVLVKSLVGLLERLLQRGRERLCAALH